MIRELLKKKIQQTNTLNLYVKNSESGLHIKI